MNLSSIRANLEKLKELADERERVGKLPLTIVVLPHNDRCPDGENIGPWPRVIWRNECAVCISYQAEAGAPTAEDIKRLLDEAEGSQP